MRSPLLGEDSGARRPEDLLVAAIGRNNGRVRNGPAVFLCAPAESLPSENTSIEVFTMKRTEPSFNPESLMTYGMTYLACLFTGQKKFVNLLC